MKAVLGKAVVAVVGGLIALGTATPAFAAPGDASLGQAFGGFAQKTVNPDGTKGYAAGKYFTEWASTDDTALTKAIGYSETEKGKLYGGTVTATAGD